MSTLIVDANPGALGLFKIEENILIKHESVLENIAFRIFL